jgi:group I intron endonuclease
MGAIYKIESSISGKAYVGSSADVERRFNEHRKRLRAGTHHSRSLQAAWIEEGDSAFAFIVLEEVADEELFVREQVWIDALNAFHGGYNAAPTAGSQRGYRHSEEALAKVRASKAGMKLTPQWNSKIRAAQTGLKRSEETKARMRAAQQARFKDPEQRAQLLERAASARAALAAKVAAS